MWSQFYHALITNNIFMFYPIFTYVGTKSRTVAAATIIVPEIDGVNKFKHGGDTPLSTNSQHTQTALNQRHSKN